MYLCLAAALMSSGACAQSATTATSAAAHPASGPTPFPADAKDWPGKGVIRVFGFMNDNRQYYWKKRDSRQGSVVFAGDSLMGGWKSMADDLPGVQAANVAIGGEPTRGLLFRFKEDVLDLHPKAIVLLTGSNDLSALEDPKLAQSNIVEMLDMAQQASPGVPIVLCTVPPRDDRRAPVEPARLLELDKLIAAAAKGRPNVVVLDVYALLANPDGTPHADYFTDDHLHISPAGYKRLRDALMPLLKRFNVA